MVNTSVVEKTQRRYRLHQKAILRDEGDYLGGSPLVVVNKAVAGAIFGVDEVTRSLLEFLRISRSSTECFEHYVRAVTEHHAGNECPSNLEESEIAREFDDLIESFLDADILVTGEEERHTTGVHPGWTHPRTFPEATHAPASFPFTIELNVTARCNLRCRHCLASATSTGITGELTTEKIFHLMDEADREGLTMLKFTGGEPFLRTDFLDLLEYATQKRFASVVLSNFTLVDEPIAVRIAELVQKAGGGLMLGFGTSIDGADAATHDAFRGLPGAFDWTTRAVKMLKNLDVDATIQICLNKQNVHQIRAMADLAHSLGASVMMFYVPTLYGAAGAAKDWLSLDEVSAAFDVVDEIFFSYPSTIIAYDANRLTFPSRPSSRNPTLKEDALTTILRLPYGTCAAGMYQMAIDADGSVYPCTFAVRGAEPAIGSVRTDSLVDIWSNKAWNTYRGGWEVSQLPVCSKCMDFEKCTTWVCRGYPAALGNFFGPMPECLECGK